MALRVRGWRRRASARDRGASERVIELESELRQARLEAERLTELAERLRSQLARTRDATEEETRLGAREEAQRLVAAIGTPLVQLMTQAHLHGTGAATIAVGDVLRTGMRLVGALRELGVDTVGEAGGTEPFDPSRHDPLSESVALTAGQPVVIRAVGLSYRDSIVRKAGVE